MKRSFIILLHIGFWACYFMLILIILSVYYRSSLYASAPGSRILIAFQNILLFAFIPSFLSFYAYYLLLFPRYLQQKKLLQSILAGYLSQFVQLYQRICFTVI